MGANALQYPAVVLTAQGVGTVTQGLEFPNVRGLLAFVNITAITGTTPTLTVTIRGKTPLGQTYTILASAALNATGLTVLRIHPGIAAVANQAASDILPPSIEIAAAVAGTGPSVTATIQLVAVD